MIKVGDTVRINDKQDFPLPSGLRVGDLVQIEKVMKPIYKVSNGECKVYLKRHEFDIVKTGIE